MNTSPLILALILIASVFSRAFADSIPIVNSSFEEDSVQGASAPLYEIRSAPPQGWDRLPETSGNDGIATPHAQGNPFYSSRTAGFTGDHVYFMTSPGKGRLRQILAAQLQANTTYTLSVASGSRMDHTPFGGYSISLETVSGTTVLSWTSANRNLAPLDNFATTTRSITTGPSPSGSGEKLQISFSRPIGNGKGFTDLDDIRLEATPAIPRPEHQPIDVFIVAGQSNAQGWLSNAAQLSAENKHYASGSPALLLYKQKGLFEPLYNTGSLANLSPQGSGFGGNFAGFGPELSLGTDLASGLKLPVAVIKFTVGAASLSGNFQKESPTAPRHLYPEMIGFLQDSLQQLRAQGYEPQLKSLFWLQGENDTEQKSAAEAYQGLILKFVADVRGDLQEPALPVFLTEINRNTPVLASRPDTTALVNQALASAAQSLPGVHYIATDDITTGFADRIHYNANQTILIGQRWAGAYLGSSQ